MGIEVDKVFTAKLPPYLPLRTDSLSYLPPDSLPLQPDFLPVKFFDDKDVDLVSC